MKATLIKIAARALLITGVFVLSATAYSLRGESTGITFATIGVDFKIDSRAFYNGVYVPGLSWQLKDLVPSVDHFFMFDDIKPGDSGKTIISAHVSKVDAWTCLDFKNLTNNENGVNEPEGLVDPNGNVSGELGKGLEFFAWRDDGDDLFEVGEVPLFGASPPRSALDLLNNKTYVLADYSIGGQWMNGTTHYIGIAWCAGKLNIDLTTATLTCDGTALGNEAQTDSLSIDVSLRAQPVWEEPQFTCLPKAPLPQGKGSISGNSYNDHNQNYQKNPGDNGLSGWTIKLFTGVNGWGTWHNNPPIKTTVTDANGNYTFGNLPDGTYSIEQVVKNGWIQLTSDYSSVTVTNGSVLVNKDFGNTDKKLKKKK
jgi:hypothetical protein